MCDILYLYITQFEALLFTHKFCNVDSKRSSSFRKASITNMTSIMLKIFLLASSKALVIYQFCKCTHDSLIQSQLVCSLESQGVSKILRACRNFGQLNAIEFRIFFRRRSFNKTSELLPMGGQSCIMSIVLHRWKLEIKILPQKRGNRDWYIFTTKCVNHHLYAEEKTVQDQIIYFTQVKFHFNNISWDEISHKYNLIG